MIGFFCFKQDVLIDCHKAVTSFSVNPVQPYYVAIGCENSLLKIYDRRSLSTGDYGTELGKQRGVLYQFKPKALEKRDCRVTSLKYRYDLIGQNIDSLELLELSSINKVSSVLVSSCSNTGSIRDDPYWTSRKNSLELIELSNINKVSLV